MKLPEKLRAEHEGILNWCVQGAVEWYKNGLQTPTEIQQATNDYRSEQDILGQFLEDVCEIGTDFKVKSADIYKAYEIWAIKTGIKFKLMKNILTSKLTSRKDIEIVSGKKLDGQKALMGIKLNHKYFYEISSE